MDIFESCPFPAYKSSVLDLKQPIVSALGFTSKLIQFSLDPNLVREKPFPAANTRCIIGYGSVAAELRVDETHLTARCVLAGQ